MHKDTLPVFISPRAIAVARGLAITGRAADAVIMGDWLRAQARRGDRRECYYIPIADGARLLRGIGIGAASELASGFATAMMVIGKRGA
jgi:hypothetical protein